MSNANANAILKLHKRAMIKRENLMTFIICFRIERNNL